MLSFVAKDESHDKSAEDKTRGADVVNEKALEETLLKDIDLTELKDFLVEKRHELLPPKSWISKLDQHQKSLIRKLEEHIMNLPTS